MNSNIDIHNLAIVVVGSFNPAIIHPEWLINKQLIRESDYDPNGIQMVHKDLTKFKLNIATIQATQDRFEMFISNEADFMPVRDLAISVFSILRETPVTSIGFNHFFHKSLDSKEYESFGNWLAPLSNWKEVMKNPRLLEVKIIEPSDTPGPRIASTIIPSDILLRSNAFRLQVNYHIDLSTKQYVHEIIDNEWSNSFESAQGIFNHLVKKYNHG